jgi:hypothetical protein
MKVSQETWEYGAGFEPAHLDPGSSLLTKFYW